MSHPDSYVIRDARPDERAALRALVLTAYDEYRQLLPGAFWEQYRAAIDERMSTADDAQRIVAEVAGRIGGVVSLYSADESGATMTASDAPPRRRIPEIRLLAVDPALRGRGLGEALIRACLSRACQRGEPVIGLHTMTVMAAAERMYLRMGFIRAPTTDFTPLPGVLVKGYRLDLLHSVFCDEARPS